MSGRDGERGQAMTEYALVVMALCLMLFVPTPLLGDPVTHVPRSVFGAFVRAFDVYLDSLHTVITLPVP